ncbi:MAG TPA: insulinase family protein [Sphingomicrobium sp.]
MNIRILAALLLTASAVPLAAQPAPQVQPGKWAQDYTGRKADPAVIFGTLPNGLRYAIMHNTTPSDGVSMRFRIGSGSLEERPEEQGLAHFLEHMAFRGSANVADGQVVQMLQRQGLSFGADTNAFTTQDETVYMFNFPKADATALATGLTLFREIGGRLTLAPAAIDAERGVILSEERLRDTPPYRMIKAQLSAALDGTRVIDRWPIGTVEDIDAANHDRIERFYRANYRPDNATIVVVGNVDPNAVEQQIKARFSDWNPAGTPDAIDLGTPTGQKKVGELVADGAPDQLSLEWVGPADRRAENEEVDRDMLLKTIGLTVLNQRLADRALEPGTPFIAARVGHQRSLFHSGSVTSIGIAASPEKWQAALDEVTAEERSLLRDEVQPGDLKRAVASIRTELENRTAQAATRKSSDIADELVRDSNADEVFTSPAQNLSFAEPILVTATPAEVTTALKAAFSEHGPILFRSARTATAGEAKLAQALDAAYARPLGEVAKRAALSWPYDNFGMPGSIGSKSVDAKLGTTLVKFANGTRLLVKPTQFEGNKILVSVLLGNGRSGVQPSLASALWQAQMFPLAGTKKLPLFQITQWAQESGKVMSIAMEAGNRAFVLKGQTRPADLATQMQLLDAYARDPGFRTEAFEKAISVAPMLSGQIEASPQATYARAAQALMVGNDHRFEFLPRTADLSNAGPKDLGELLARPLAGQADVIIVGDVTVDQAIAATQATFGSGKGGLSVPPAVVSVSVAEGRPTPYVFRHSGRADQAVYGEYFRLPDYFQHPEATEVSDVAAAIISSRLIDTVREQLGITYAPQAQALTAIDLPGEGYLGVTLETPPENFDKFRALLAGEIKDLATKPVSDDELARAKKPLIETELKRRETNGYWAASLGTIMREPRAETEVLQRPGKLAAVTAADVQQLVAKYLAGRQPVVVISEKGAANAPMTVAPPAKSKKSRAERG